MYVHMYIWFLLLSWVTFMEVHPVIDNIVDGITSHNQSYFITGIMFKLQYKYKEFILTFYRLWK